jgi:hypothetical protein
MGPFYESDLVTRLFISNFTSKEPTQSLDNYSEAEDRRVLLPSSYWLIHFSDFHKIVLKSGRQLLAAFQKSFAKIREMYQPIGRKGFKFMRK